MAETGSTEANPHFAPVGPAERVAIIDVLRGFALLGILVMNVPAFNTPWSAFVLDPPLFPDELDRKTKFVMEFLLAGKANSIFTFLFGLGVAIQMRRAELRATPVTPMYLRRMAALFGIGAAHALLIWDGDVLHIYAIIGLLLLAIRRASDGFILGLALLLLVAPQIRTMWALYHNEAPAHPLSFYIDTVREHTQVFTSGSYGEQVITRITFFQDMYGVAPRLQGMIWTYVSFSVTMLLGFLAGRRGVLQDVSAHAPEIRRATAACLVLGFAAAASFALLSERDQPMDPASLFGFGHRMLHEISRPLLCIGYVGALALLFLRPGWRRGLMWLADSGRIPLTNYIAQSVVATALFYSWGFALYGQVGPALGLAITAVIFAMQIVWSRWWLARFRYGPLEWLWRGVAYRRLPPLR